MYIRKVLASLAATSLCLWAGLGAQAGPADVNTAEAYWWWGDPAGSSKIVRTDKGISGNISVHLGNDSGSAGGIVITLWLVIFNNPGECEGECVDTDLFNPAVMADVVYGGGNVVGGSEKATIGFRYPADSNAGSIATLFGMPTDDGEGYGLRDPRGAEVHYVIRFHGPVNTEAMPAQMQGYEGGCIDFAPYGYPFPTGSDDLYLGWGQCQDVIFAVNPP